MRAILTIIVLFGGVALAGKPPATDPTLDWLMHQSATATATQPATQPAGVFKPDDDNTTRNGTIETSDGKSIHGPITTTPEKPIRIWIEAEKQYQDIPLDMIQSIEATVLWERDEQEWKFKASGSDVKEYSGKTYPARETSYKITTTDDQTFEGGVVAPLFVTTKTGDKTLVLHKRDKGEAGQTLKDLVYVKTVRFDDPSKAK